MTEALMLLAVLIAATSAGTALMVLAALTY